MRKYRFFLVFIVFVFSTFSIIGTSYAQKKPIPERDGRPGLPQPGNVNTNDRVATPSANSARPDSGIFKHRDDLADSITISYRYLDSLRSVRLDSSINDFNKFYSLPADYVALANNNGSAAYPIFYIPFLKAGWDAGFHAFDVYRYSLQQARFYKTTKPFTRLTYLLASGKEQLVNVLHTQNISTNWNFGFDYRLIATPGFYKSQNTNHNNYRLFSNYTGKRKRYNAYLVLVGNKLNASENGGIRNDSLISDPQFKKRFTIPVNLSGDTRFSQNYFSSNVSTGNRYRDFTFFYRHSYDVGKKDSIAVNDSTTEYLFYPKLRFQHTFSYNKYRFQYRDTLDNGTDAALDSAFYKQRYDTAIAISLTGMNFNLEDKWEVITNDFSLRQFPETKNPAQFIDAGIRLENLNGSFSLGVHKYYNIVVHGEYHNKTRNKKWDAFAKGDLYVNGLNAGDYNLHASVRRTLSGKLGDVKISFQDVNRSPSFIFNEASSFNFKNGSLSKKENWIVFAATAENPLFNILVRNISITNFTYFTDYYHTTQEAALLNILQGKASKKFRLTKHFNLYSDVLLQQTTSNSPIRLPLLFTRQRLAFEGFFFKNLNLSTGLDVSYSSPYKYYDYSPVNGQFVPQDTVTTKNLPNVAAFFNFRIKTFTGLLKLENLNALNLANGLSFTNNNFTAPHYATPGLLFRIGVQWAFVN
ncbi:hypothetical protein BH09BAC2_BH09BAC2_14440 [soil metagenome]